ncbi:MAG: bifunctional oligoribonuclease/PAP phosphatase NrnA [Lachnospiraceae bacterium]|nr:bifunctional oligoribonuclease/PAP phosphatase NrnA [Lachnospiraceae bacterium]
MKNIFEVLQDVEHIGITGHIRPDGDCIGSIMSLYNYIVDNMPELDVDVYAQRVPENFRYIKNIDKVIVDYPDVDKVYDVMICLDSSDLERIGEADKYFKSAKKTVCIDHHISNDSYADICHVLPNASSTCEVLFDLFEEDKISKSVAEALYTGVIHDTGVFKHSNTSKHTLEVAGCLINKGVAFSKIIDESFYQKTFLQNQILGKCLLNASMTLGNKVIYSYIDLKTMEENKAMPSDLDGVIDQLRITEGIEVAILLHETSEGIYKISMRSNNDVNVSEIAMTYGGGGHIKAAGCSAQGDIHTIIEDLVDKISKQL